MNTSVLNTEVDEEHQIDELLAPFKGGGRAITIQALQAIQEKLGYLSPYALEKTASYAGVSTNTVAGAATFYSQLVYVKPGRHKIAVCRGTACHVRMAPLVLEAVERVLGIKEGETSQDGEYSLETVACIGACALAPTMRIDDDTYGQLTTKKIEEIFLERAKKEETIQE